MFTTEIDEMTLIPYKDSHPLESHYNIFVSGRRPSQNPEMRQTNQIHSILSLGFDNQVQDFEALFDKSRYLLLDLADNENAPISSKFDEWFRFIDNALQAGNVLVHCTMGVSRSVAIIVAYLMMKFKIGYESAISIVRKNRQMAFPNEGFKRQLKELEQNLGISNM